MAEDNEREVLTDEFKRVVAEIEKLRKERREATLNRYAEQQAVKKFQRIQRVLRAEILLKYRDVRPEAVREALVDAEMDAEPEYNENMEHLLGAEDLAQQSIIDLVEIEEEMGVCREYLRFLTASMGALARS